MSAVAMELRYEPLERLHVQRPVDRIEFVASACRGRTVLDLGALDETALSSKRGRGTWLHEAIAATATRVIGIDNSSEVPEAGLSTATNAEIRRGDVTALHPWLAANDFVPEVIVAGELLEHLPNPLQFLRSLVEIDRLRGSTLIVTTPNATAVHNVAIGLLSRESTHHDHLCILSYKTLHTLFRRAGFSNWRIVPYRAAFIEMRHRNAGLRGGIVAAGEKAINVIEWLFPLLSFGYVVVASL
jgi:Methyltransferase domain